MLGSTACQDAFRAWSKSVGEYERQRDIAFWNRDNDGGDPFQAPAVADVELMGDRAKDEATARRALAAVMAQELAS
ncbi:hypothetical protein SAMN03159343_0249 [Klenkia marina]|uniref:Uncharacterized protein n=1 Tax=Klenkia marina TaxID=1960309 RepID=A0A1G4X9P6_9ACTN|nr:hypothetical protein SAMN03159343_0249 [Klenkia marina]